MNSTDAYSERNCACTFRNYESGKSALVDSCGYHLEIIRALAGIMNYWEPDCKAEDCDKGHHVEALIAWNNAKAILVKHGEPT